MKNVQVNAELIISVEVCKILYILLSNGIEVRRGKNSNSDKFFFPSVQARYSVANDPLYS